MFDQILVKAVSSKMMISAKHHQVQPNRPSLINLIIQTKWAPPRGCGCHQHIAGTLLHQTQLQTLI